MRTGKLFKVNSQLSHTKPNISFTVEGKVVRVTYDKANPHVIYDQTFKAVHFLFSTSIKRCNFELIASFANCLNSHYSNFHS